MQHSHHENTESNNGGSWLFSRTGIATLVAVSILGFLIYEGHGAHLLGYAPFLLILACPLMHIFMHGGHGGHGGHGNRSDEEKETRAPEDQKKNSEHSHGGHR